MAAKRKAGSTGMVVKAPCGDQSSTVKAKAKITVKRSTPRNLPIFPKLYPARHITTPYHTSHNTSPSYAAPKANSASFPDVAASDNTMDAKHQAAESQHSRSESESDSASVRSWEEDITRWPPGQRPPLHHHPFDRWMNRPTVRWGKCGRRLPTPGPRHYTSDEEADDGQVKDEAAKEPITPRLRGGWLRTWPNNDFDNFDGVDFVRERAMIPPSEADSLISTELDSLYFQGYVVTVRLLKGRASSLPSTAMPRPRRLYCLFRVLHISDSGFLWSVTLPNTNTFRFRISLSPHAETNTSAKSTKIT